MDQTTDPTLTIREKAVAFPAVDKGTSCNQSSFKTGKRAFLFIGPGPKGKGFKAMFKLKRSMPQAEKLSAQLPDRFEIGSTYEYSNLAVGLLGHVLAGVGGGSYEDVVRERILYPLGMSMTGITLEGDMADWMTKGHNQNGNVVPLWDLPTFAGAGALRSNTEDMLAFLAANTGTPETRLEQSMRESHEAHRSVNVQMSIGLGWHIRRVGDEKIFWHGGGTGGFRTFIGFDPSSGVAAVVLTNSGISADDIGFHLINPDVPLTVERAEIDVAPEILSSYVGEYELTPFFSIVVRLVGDSLFLQATGQPRLRMYATSETDFSLRVVDAQISFTMSETGQVTGMVLHQNGVDQTGVRIR